MQDQKYNKSKNGTNKIKPSKSTCILKENKLKDIKLQNVNKGVKINRTMKFTKKMSSGKPNKLKIIKNVDNRKVSEQNDNNMTTQNKKIKEHISVNISIAEQIRYRLLQTIPDFCRNS